jgi:hypothetical protein
MNTNATIGGTKSAAPFALRAVVRWQVGAGQSREEISGLLDVTPHGATLLLTDPPELGQLLCLQLPGSRTHAQGMQMWALVWAVAQTGESSEAMPPRSCVSVIFVNDDVPSAGREGEASLYAYLIEENGRLRLQRQQGVDSRDRQRRESRLSVPLEVTLEALRPDGTVLMREQTVTENISRSGAAVWTSLLIGARQAVRLTSERHGISILGVVRARRIGPDGIARLHLEFTGGQWPIEKIA